jgi:hypothetical protein
LSLIRDIGESVEPEQTLVHPGVFPGEAEIIGPATTTGSGGLGCVAHGAGFKIVSVLTLPVVVPLLLVTRGRSFITWPT